MKNLIVILGSILLVWIVLTLYVQWKGSVKSAIFGQGTGGPKASLVYNPDRFYNLDEQVCLALAKALAENGWTAQVATVATAEEIVNDTFDVYIFCANTYNWRPDWPTSRYIRNHPLLKGRPVVAITLGCGSTQRSQRLLDELIRQKGANLIFSEVIWLMKPNDEARTKESNVGVALDKAAALGVQISQTYLNKPGQDTSHSSM